MKGAVERIIDACTHVETEGGLVPLDEEMEQKIHANVEALAEQGLRVLGLAQKTWAPASAGPESTRAEVEDGMVLQGLVGLYGTWPRLSLIVERE
jgi:Na+-exporting ATPase